MSQNKKRKKCKINVDDPSTFVTCQICGKRVSMINTAHLKTHDLTREEYERMFPTANLVAKSYKQSLSRNSYEVSQLPRVKEAKKQALLRQWATKSYRRKVSRRVRRQALKQWADSNSKMNIVHECTGNKSMKHPNKKAIYTGDSFSLQLKELWKNKDFVEKKKKLASNELKLRWKTNSEFRHSISKANMEKLSNPRFKEHMSVKQRLAWKRPETVKKHLKASRSPENRERVRQQCLRQLKDPENDWGYFKFKRYIFNNEIKMRSQWEVDFAESLYEANVEFEYESHTFLYINPEDNKEHIYVTDFYIKELDLYIEIKPSSKINKKQQAKFSAVRSAGESLLVVTEKNWNLAVNGIVRVVHYLSLVA